MSIDPERQKSIELATAFVAPRFRESLMGFGLSPRDEAFVGLRIVCRMVAESYPREDANLVSKLYSDALLGLLKSYFDERH